MVSNLQTHVEQSRERASFKYKMTANAGVIKAIVSSYRVYSDTAFERHKSRIPIIDLNIIQFLGLKEQRIKYGLGDFDIDFGREKG